jgi:hypothetical protein
MISNKEKKRRQHKKELNSFRNKMGKDLAWFDSLSLKKKYDLLFKWKAEKKYNKRESPSKVRIYHSYLHKKIDVMSYPPNLKYFIKEKKAQPYFTPRISDIREATIDILLKNKN